MELKNYLCGINKKYNETSSWLQFGSHALLAPQANFNSA